MINYEALRTVSYGIYLICSGNATQKNGYIANTFFQVSAKPVKLAIACNKNNRTTDIIEQTSVFSVAVLHQQVNKDLVRKFGYNSGEEIDKFAGLEFHSGKTGTPIIKNDSVAYFECKVEQRIDVGTHWLYIAELVDAQMVDETKEPLTYAHYREVFKATSPEKAPTYIQESNLQEEEKSNGAKKNRCKVCGFIYDDALEEVKFEELPNDWKCPICGATKDDFEEID